MTFISVENLTTHYNTSKGSVHALEDVSFSLEKGESIGIAGESACGKSTLGLSLIRMVKLIDWFKTTKLPGMLENHVGENIKI